MLKLPSTSVADASLFPHVASVSRVWNGSGARSLKSFLSNCSLTHWRTCQSSSWFSVYWLVFSPSRLTAYFRSTLVAGQALMTSWVTPVVLDGPVPSSPVVGFGFVGFENCI